MCPSKLTISHLFISSRTFSRTAHGSLLTKAEYKRWCVKIAPLWHSQKDTWMDYYIYIFFTQQLPANLTLSADRLPVKSKLSLCTELCVCHRLFPLLSSAIHRPVAMMPLVFWSELNRLHKETHLPRRDEDAAAFI